jgi:enoyl-CoA hydratase
MLWTRNMRRPCIRRFWLLTQMKHRMLRCSGGEGGAFCAGADLKRVAARDEEKRPSLEFPKGDGPVPRGPMGPSRLQLSRPVIAAIEGPAVAGGMELALWADCRIMAEDAYMGVYCRRWGVPLSDGGTVRLPRLVGQGRALEIIMTGRKVDAHECLRIGLCEKVVPHGMTRQAAEDMAREIARFPQGCMRADRRSVYLQYGMPERVALEREWVSNTGIVEAEGAAGQRALPAASVDMGTSVRLRRERLTLDEASGYRRGLCRKLIGPCGP